MPFLMLLFLMVMDQPILELLLETILQDHLLAQLIQMEMVHQVVSESLAGLIIYQLLMELE